MQRIGLIGDVHAEHDFLATALDHLARERVDAIVCVGDLVDGRGDVDRCVEQLVRHGVHTVRGNHDRWLLGDVTKMQSLFELHVRTRDYLAALPKTRLYDTADGPLLLCHGLGDDDMVFIDEVLTAATDDNARRAERARLQRLGGLTIVDAAASSRTAAMVGCPPRCHMEYIHVTKNDGGTGGTGIASHNTADEPKNGDAGLEAEVSGVGKLKVSRGVLATLFPERHARARIIQAIGERIADKFKVGDTAFSEAELSVFAILFERDFKKAANREAVVERARALLAEKPSEQRRLTSGEATERRPTSEHWVNRILADSEEVSDEGIRELYAHILKGEHEAPGSFSLHTLSVLRSIDVATIRAFEALCALVFNNYLFNGPDSLFEIYEKKGLAYPDFLALTSVGLLSMANSQVRSRARDDGGQELLAQHGQGWFRATCAAQHPFALKVWTLTIPGEELASIPSLIEDPDFLAVIAKHIATAFGTLALTAQEIIVVEWTSDGESFKEMARTPLYASTGT